MCWFTVHALRDQLGTDMRGGAGGSGGSVGGNGGAFTLSDLIAAFRVEGPVEGLLLHVFITVLQAVVDSLPVTRIDQHPASGALYDVYGWREVGVATWQEDLRVVMAMHTDNYIPTGPVDEMGMCQIVIDELMQHQVG
jgi:hypothetical protein